jgi:hypothetical protein
MKKQQLLLCRRADGEKEEVGDDGGCRTLAAERIVATILN